jgi:uncharacterized repeat protein (TIGR01451 family)
VQFQTVQPIQLPAGSPTHSVTFSVNVATINCPGSIPGYPTNAPLLQFRLIDPSSGTAYNIGSIFNPCSVAGANVYTITPPYPPGQVNPAPVSARVTTLRTTAALPFSGTSFIVQLINYEGRGNGNDAAIDNIMVTNATPELSKSFSPATTTPGSPSTLTFTISNSPDNLAKSGITFTDTLPAGLVIATPPNTSTNCSGGSVGATAGSNVITFSGNLLDGQASCTASVSVRQTSAVAQYHEQYEYPAARCGRGRHVRAAPDRTAGDQGVQPHCPDAGGAGHLDVHDHQHVRQPGQYLQFHRHPAVRDDRRQPK